MKHPRTVPLATLALKHRGLRLAVAALTAHFCWAAVAFAQTAPSLGAAQSFVVLAGSTVTNTGATVVSGD